MEGDECQKRTILTDSSKIIEAVETVRDGSFQPQLGEGNHQPLVPTEAAARQDYEKLMAIIDKVCTVVHIRNILHKIEKNLN